MKLLPYADASKELWDETVRRARNATFLFERDFMDYHRDRFTDCSLLFLSEKGRPVACLPANFKADTREVESHGGLTYGGLLLTPEVTTTGVGEILETALLHFRSLGAKRLTYKPVPHIYHVYPCEEELYWLFRLDARLTARAVSTTIRLDAPYPFAELRRRKVRRAEREGLRFSLHDTDGTARLLPAYWDILTEVLRKNHGVRPVHTPEEIARLHHCFPEAIQLATVSNPSGRLLAGTLLFVTPRVVHAQYIAAADEGRSCGALDFLFSKLLDRRFDGREFLDFGISTEAGGRVLNEGLIFQKEGFGGRATCYDTYTIDL